MLRLYLRLCTILSRSIQKESISQYLLFFTSIMNRSRRHTYILPLEVSIYHWHSLVSHFGSSEILVNVALFSCQLLLWFFCLPERACKRVSHFAIRVSLYCQCTSNCLQAEYNFNYIVDSIYLCNLTILLTTTLSSAASTPCPQKNQAPSRTTTHAKVCPLARFLRQQRKVFMS